MPSQPSHLASSSPVQSEASPAQSLRTHCRPCATPPAIGDGAIECRRQFPAQAGDRAAHQLGAFFRHRAEQIIRRIGKELHAVLDEMLGHAWQIQAQPFGFRQDVPRLFQPLAQRVLGTAMRAEGIHGRGRHGVDRIAADQLLDVQHIAIGLVLGAGAGPEQALRIGARCRQLLPALGGHFLVPGIGLLGIGDRHPAAHFLQRVGLRVARRHALVDLLVDLRIDAADEETRDAGYARNVQTRATRASRPTM